MVHDGTSTAENALQIWAQTLLWVVPAAIVMTIGLTILAAIIQAAVTGDDRVIFLKDERDRQIELFGLGAMMLVLVLGFVGAMAALAWGVGGFVAFNLIYLAFFVGDIAANLIKLGLYRFGT